ncbi:hypothetical protein CFC21_000107 [Triticum aestivum]|uniref:Uncharacterized protein n=1 Tax=Triticum aestivum TaxID=4565 RepID=A0A3B6U710_WHEAT|nr:hypothetical protein CFC21_000107 [Triticum aestivum]
MQVEMVHTMSLVHDDLPCMEDDHLRRGKPTCHIVYGEPIAALTCDSLLALAFQHMASVNSYPPDIDPDKHTARVVCVIDELARCIGSEGLVAGQVSRLIYSDFVTQIVQLVMGAIIGGGSDDQIERLRKYSSEELGKTAGKDSASDKTTYQNLLGLEKSWEFAENLLCDAKEQLADFDKHKAAPLLSLADYIAYRQN